MGAYTGQFPQTIITRTPAHTIQSHSHRDDTHTPHAHNRTLHCHNKSARSTDWTLSTSDASSLATVQGSHIEARAPQTCARDFKLERRLLRAGMAHAHRQWIHHRGHRKERPSRFAHHASATRPPARAPLSPRPCRPLSPRPCTCHSYELARASTRIYM